MPEDKVSEANASEDIKDTVEDTEETVNATNEAETVNEAQETEATQSYGQSIINLDLEQKGQLEGISKMIEEDRYCMDISNQIMATEAILRKVNEEILKAHMNHCVKEALIEGDGEEKIDEIFNILNKMYK